MVMRQLWESGCPLWLQLFVAPVCMCLGGVRAANGVVWDKDTLTCPCDCRAGQMFASTWLDSAGPGVPMQTQLAPSSSILSCDAFSVPLCLFQASVFVNDCSQSVIFAAGWGLQA